MTLLFLAKCRVVRCFFLLLCACCGRLFLRANDHPRVFWVLAAVEAQRDDAVGSDAFFFPAREQRGKRIVVPKETKKTFSRKKMLREEFKKRCEASRAKVSEEEEEEEGEEGEEERRVRLRNPNDEGKSKCVASRCKNQRRTNET